MPLLHFLLGAALLQTEPDPNLLPIGSKGSVTVQPGQIIDVRTGKPATADDLARAAEGKPYVFLGENHATTEHQKMESTVIEALANAKRKVAVGLEMYTRPKQDVLDEWSAGSLSEDAFLEKSEWKVQWGYPYPFYKPVFDSVLNHHLPLIALNVPRDWVRKVGKKGYAGLPTSAKLQLPADLYLGNKDHRKLFDAMVGPHQGMGSMDNMYAAQVLWDEGMADTAVKYRAVTPTERDSVFVVIAGSGHIMYKQGIPYRIHRHKGGEGISLIMISSDKPVEVSKGIGDFVYVTLPDPKTPQS